MAYSVTKAPAKLLSCSRYKELTAKYYSEILLRFIKRRHYSEVWKEFKREHEIKHTLEKAAILVANCFQIKEESVNKTVTQHLNSIAEAVRESIRQDSKVCGNGPKCLEHFLLVLGPLKQ